MGGQPSPWRVPRGSALCALALAGSALLAAGCLGAGKRGANSDATWRSAEPLRPATRRGHVRSSFYLTMRDGVPIAIDLYLPRDLRAGERLPCIVRQTRYWRATRLRWPLNLRSERPAPLTRAFVERGYAWVDVDVRGSGASGGWQPYPWSPDEVADGREILDWIVAQPWSNGHVGLTGVSYDGTSAEMLAASGHPAVKAVAPRFSLFDTYTDIAMPGGVHLSWFTEQWSRFNRALDQADLSPVLPWIVSWMVAGPRPVDGDRDGRELRAQLPAHARNYDVHAAALRLTFRDEVAPDREGAGSGTEDGLRVDEFSPHARWRGLDRSGAAVFSYGGWFDGAYAHAAIKRHRSLSAPGREHRLLLGPWNHGGTQNIDPERRRRRAEFDHTGELLRFFDRQLREVEGTEARDEAPRVTYYTLVEGRWKHADSWPPPAQPLSLYLAPGGRLAAEPPRAPQAEDGYAVDPQARTGERSRWNSLMGDHGPIEYPDRAQQDQRLLVYQGAPLGRDTEVTGHPRVVLFVAASAADAAIFAYLEDVGPQGEVTYVTEGQLRLLHRKVKPLAEAPYALGVPFRSFRRADALPLESGRVAEIEFDLLPTSYLFHAGHSIRLALAGADADHFAPLPGDPPSLQFQRSAAHPSRLVLPVVPR